MLEFAFVERIKVHVDCIMVLTSSTILFQCDEPQITCTTFACCSIGYTNLFLFALALLQVQFFVDGNDCGNYLWLI